MSYLSDVLGTVPGDDSDLRDITVPAIGDEYIDSHHQTLATTEKYTVYFATEQADLPDPSNYDTLVGIAETTHDDISGKTVHLHDGSQWVDTHAEPVDETGLVRAGVDNLEEYVSIEDYDSLEEVAGTVDTTTETITDIQNQIGDVDVQEDIVTWFDTELSNTVGDDYIDTTDDTIRGDITTLESDFETAVGSDYIDNSPTNVDERLTTISEKISCIQDHIEDADFDPNMTSTPDENTIIADETGTFEAEITNTGHKPGSQTITLNAYDSQVDSQEVNSLCGDVNTDQPSISNTETVSVEWTPSESDVGSTDVTVETGDGSSATVSITVLEPVEFDVYGATADPNPVTEDNQTTITATVENLDDRSGDADVKLLDDSNTQVAHKSNVTIAGGKTKDVSLNWTPTSFGHGRTLTVETDDHSTTVDVDVDETDPSISSFSADSTTVTKGNPVSFTASATNVNSYTIDWGDGSSSTGSSLPSSPSHTYSSTGTYSATLTVTNSTGQTATASTSDITVNAPTPTVRLSADSTTVDSGTSVSFTASATNVDSYTIDWGDGSSNTGSSLPSSPSHTYSSTGTYSATLTVENSTGQTATDSTSDITVNPVAYFSITDVSTNSPVIGSDATVTVDVKNTGDAEGTQSVSVDAGDLGTKSTDITLGKTDTENPTLSFSTSNGDAGSYDVTASTGDESQTATLDVTGEVTASIGYSGDLSDIDTAVDFYGTGSTNADSYSWDFGDGNSATGSSPSHTYSSAGTYTVSLTASNDNTEDTATTEITVGESYYDVTITDVSVTSQLNGQINVYASYDIANTNSVDGEQNVDVDLYYSGSGWLKQYTKTWSIDGDTTESYSANFYDIDPENTQIRVDPETGSADTAAIEE